MFYIDIWIFPYSNLLSSVPDYDLYYENETFPLTTIVKRNKTRGQPERHEFGSQ